MGIFANDAKLIGLAGRMGSGKSTIAEKIRSEYSSLILPISNQIKKYLLDLGWDGVKDEKGRKLLQLFGTDCVKNCIDKYYWIKLWCFEYYKARFYGEAFKYIIVDDVRFEEEVEIIESYGGKVFRILNCFTTGKLKRKNIHLSEKDLNVKTIRNIDAAKAAKEILNEL